MTSLKSYEEHAACNLVSMYAQYRKREKNTSFWLRGKKIIQLQHPSQNCNISFHEFLQRNYCSYFLNKLKGHLFLITQQHSTFDQACYTM